jgi:starch phosphorylase
MNPEPVKFPNLPERLNGFGELAGNLCWSWHSQAKMQFKMLARKAWKESGSNPDKMFKKMQVERSRT